MVWRPDPQPHYRRANGL